MGVPPILHQPRAGALLELFETRVEARKTPWNRKDTPKDSKIKGHRDTKHRRHFTQAAQRVQSLSVNSIEHALMICLHTQYVEYVQSGFGPDQQQKIEISSHLASESD